MYQRILVPIDGSPTSNRGLDEAVAMARLTGGRIRLLHVINESAIGCGLEGAARFWGEMAAALQEAGQNIVNLARSRVAEAGIAVDTLLPEISGGRVADVVIEQALAWQADLIVIGTHGRRGVRRLVLGSDAEQILRAAPVPVLLVRGG
jgi:nucleotide-binding universal stress UspA family protein